jgi:hypothetical protein
VVATISIGWTIFRELTSGAKIEVQATPNMSVFPESPLTAGKRYISVTAINRGTAPTTITHFCGFQAKNWWAYVRRKRQGFVVTAGGPLGNSVPHVLGPGEQWSNLAEQSKIATAAGTYLRIGVIHNQRSAPVLIRVRLPSAK